VQQGIEMQIDASGSRLDAASKARTYTFDPDLERREADIIRGEGPQPGRCAWRGGLESSRRPGPLWPVPMQPQQK